MPEDCNHLEVERIQRDTGIGCIVWRHSTPSTNTLAADLAKAGELEFPALVYTENQTAGRGQPGRTWYSSEGSLTFTLALAPLTPGPVLPLLVGQAILRALRAMTAERGRASQSRPEEFHEWAIKWPNDILLNSKKLGGILVESLPATQVVLIGVGLNVNNELPNELDSRGSLGATNLKRNFGEELSITDVLIRTLRSLLESSTIFRSERMSEETVNSINCDLAFRGERIRFLSPGEPVSEGKLLGIDDNGALCLEANGKVATFSSGQISIGH